MSDQKRPSLTLSEAADQCRRQDDAGVWSSVSRKTVQRAQKDEKFPNSYRADDGGRSPWLIPIEDLIAEGFIPGGGRTFVADPALAESAQVAGAEVVELRSKLKDAQHRAELAEAKLDGAEKRAETAELALRALTTGEPRRAFTEAVPEPGEPPVAPEGNPDESQVETPQKRGLLKRAWADLRSGGPSS